MILATLELLPVRFVPDGIEAVVDDARLGQLRLSQEDVDEGIRHVFLVHL